MSHDTIERKKQEVVKNMKEISKKEPMECHFVVNCLSETRISPTSKNKSSLY